MEMKRTWKGQRNLRRKEIPEVFIDPLTVHCPVVTKTGRHVPTGQTE